MSIQQHAATTALLADASLQAAPVQGFNVVAKGYHRSEVDEWVHWALGEIERLGSFVGREASSPEGQRLLAEVVQMAADELTGQKDAATAMAEQIITGAHQQADGIIGHARAQAEQHIASATQQAAALVSSARADAKNTTDDAAAHAAAVHEAAGERLAQFAKVHQDGLLRMSQMNQVTGDYLAEEKARGSLKDEVDKALAAVRR